MTTQVLQFVELSHEDRKETGRLGKLGKGDRVEVRVKRRSGPDQTLSLPPDAAALIEALLGHLLEGDRVAVLTEDQELSPNDAASILGVSRPLVVHRMEVGELPFRYVGKHRRAKLKDVLVLKTKIDAQRAAMEALAQRRRGSQAALWCLRSPSSSSTPASSTRFISETSSCKSPWIVWSMRDGRMRFILFRVQ